MSTKFKCRAIAVGAAVLTLPSAGMSQQQTYIYNVGPNVINQSASSCRAASQTDDQYVVRAAGEVSVPAGISLAVYCPLQRRNNAFYGISGNTSHEVGLNASSVSVYAYDPSTTNALSCLAFRQNYSTGAIAWGTEKYLCATAGGCTSFSASYTGSNTLTLNFAAATTQTVNYGYTCRIANGGKVYWAEMSVTPNP
jgi:hypothetical protein